MLRPLALAALALAGAAQAQTGKIVGTVTDGTYEGPLPGAQVFIQELQQGAVTRDDGSYQILNVRAGTYTLVFKFIGYADVRVEDVVVEIDQTTRRDITLREAAIEGEEVVVIADVPIVERGRTTTSATVTEAQLDALPVASLQEAVDLQAGVVDGHFRGGRRSEVSYLVNGVPINNAYSNSQAFEVEQNMVQSLQVISGVFNAEYGQALSGVVNVVTKDAPREWSGSALGYVGTYLSGREVEFTERLADAGDALGLDDFRSVRVPFSDAASAVGRADVQLSAGGPVLPGRLGVRVTGRYFRDEGDEISRRLFAPSDSSSGLSGNLSRARIGSTGDQSFVSAYEERVSVNPSIVYNPANGLRLDYNLFYQQGRGQDYNHRRRYVPDGTNTGYNETATHIAGLRWSPTGRSFVSASYSLLTDHFESRLYDLPADLDATGVLDRRYVTALANGFSGTNAFNVAGNQLVNEFRRTQTHTAVADYTAQVNDVHEVKAGATLRLHRLDNLSYGIQVDAQTGFVPRRSPNPFDGDSLSIRPVEFAAFVQDKMEFDQLIVNAGLRFDYFDPRYELPVDFAQADRLEIEDPENPGTLISNRTAAPSAIQLSPRLGVAFPISERGVLRFSSGLFFQTPPFQLLYRNAEYDVDPTDDNRFGNAGLDPERTLAVELGLQQGFTDDLGAEVTVFLKDIRNLVGEEVQRSVTTTNFLTRFVNRDYGTVRGVTLSLFQRDRGAVAWTVDYTLQFAEGTSSNPGEAFARQQAGEAETVRLTRLDWDRRHTLNTSLSLAPVRGLEVTMINRFLSGQPYTSVRRFVRSPVDNNLDRPGAILTDVRAYYAVPLPSRPQLFLQVDNLFDAEVQSRVYSDTGRADESVVLEQFRRSGTLVGGVNSLDEFFYRPDWFGPPRRVSLGLRVTL